MDSCQSGKLERLPNAEAFLCSGPDSVSNEETGIETEIYGEGLEIPPDLSTTLKSTTIV
jgi:hypothetical protein